MKELSVTVQGMDRFLQGAVETARRIDAGQESPARAELSFETADGLARCLTANTWRILETLRVIGPTSIRSLARILERDYRGVHSDVSKLLDVELLEKNGDGLLIAPWDRITLDFANKEAA
jgi:predicted transcriptional regulator